MPGVADGSLPVIDVPKVDISLLSSSCPATAKAETEKLRSALLSSLGLDENSLVDEMGEEPRTVMRLNLYPKCSVPDRVLGLNSHTDGSAITFLLQDKEVEGFQLMLKDGRWVRVPVTPTDALLIKIGDQGEVRAYACVCIVYWSIKWSPKFEHFRTDHKQRRVQGTVTQGCTEHEKGKEVDSYIQFAGARQGYRTSKGARASSIQADYKL
ncbi:Jasmonate-induced oxygenase 4 [Linum perenne]